MIGRETEVNNAIDVVKAGFKERKGGNVINSIPVENATTMTPTFPRENMQTAMPPIADDDNITVPEGVNNTDQAIPQEQHQQTERPPLRRTTRTRLPTEAKRSYLETRDPKDEGVKEITYLLSNHT